MVESTGTETLGDYLKKYDDESAGHTNGYFTRLIRIVEQREASKPLRIQAVKLVLQAAIEQKKLGFYMRVHKIVEENFVDSEASKVPSNLRNKNWESKVRQEYSSEINSKNLEIQSFQKNQLKDSIRLGLNDLGDIHAKYGFLYDAMSLWEKSYDMSAAPEDQQAITRKIIFTAFEHQHQYLLGKYADRAIATDNGKDEHYTMTLYLMSVFANLYVGQYTQAASKLTKMACLSGQNPDLKRLVTFEDLAFYLVLVCLGSLSRKELKEQVLSNSQVLQLLENHEQTHQIFDNYLNGRFEKFQAQLNTIEAKLQYDLFFGNHVGAAQIFKRIRTKTLEQYVAPYKVIDMREIATAFGRPLDLIEGELAELITSGQIKAKIDSSKKLLHSRQKNTQYETYKQAVQVGEAFITNTEDTLLKIALLQNDMTLVNDQRAPIRIQ